MLCAAISLEAGHLMHSSQHPAGSIYSSYMLGKSAFGKPQAAPWSVHQIVGQSGTASPGRVGTGESRMVLEQGKSWLEGSITGLVLVLSCLSASGGRFWLQLRYSEEAANRRGPQLSPGTIASPQPLWGQIPAIQTTPLPVPNLLGAAGGNFIPWLLARGRVHLPQPWTSTGSRSWQAWTWVYCGKQSPHRFLCCLRYSNLTLALLALQI